MINIKKVKRNFIALHTLFALIVGGIGGVLLYAISPQYYFGGYPFIPLYFYLFGLFGIYMFEACQRYAPQKMLLLYLAIKGLKMFLSMAVLLLSCVIMKEQGHLFLLTFVSFYLLYLVFETWFFFSFELRLERKRKNNKK